MTAPTSPAEISVDDVWDLHARPDLIDRAATGWRQAASAITKATADVDAKATALVGGVWAGEAADTFDAHRRKLTADLDDTADQAEAVSNALGKIAGSVRAAQGHLTDEWGKVIGVPLTYDRAFHLLFSPRTTGESTVVIGSSAAPGTTRSTAGPATTPCSAWPAGTSCTARAAPTASPRARTATTWTAAPATTSSPAASATTPCTG
jgi:uncharacterized protein YukE